MSSRRQSAKVIKKNDGEPLSRVDLQYDLLHAIFHDTNQVFTDPFPSQLVDGRPARSLVTFRDLYVNAIMNSTKLSKLLKDKMIEHPDFATDFAMLSLLTNVGRINTTMSFFHEVRTPIRTYHPIPALQRTSGSLLDAPRLKSIVKSVVYESEAAHPVTSLRNMQANIDITPPTHIANLIFLLANDTSTWSKAFFSGEIDFLDLFVPADISSHSRARVFLWLVYHYYEAAHGSAGDNLSAIGTGKKNPFSEHGNPPALERISASETALENVDPDDEKLLADKLIAQRMQFKAQNSKENTKGGNGSVDDTESVLSVESAVTKPRGKREVRIHKIACEKVNELQDVKKPRKDGFIAEDSIMDTHLEHPTRLSHSGPAYRTSSLQTHPAYIRHRSPSFGPRYAPYTSSSQLMRSHDRFNTRMSLSPPRTLLQHTWHAIKCTDPLLDSDDEVGDEHSLHDYTQRLNIITRLRGKDPTPEPENAANIGSRHRRKHR